MRCNACVIAIVCVTIVLTSVVTSASAASVAFNWGRTDSHLAVDEVAGLVAQANWTNTEAIDGFVQNLVDDSGDATTVDVEWVTSEIWSFGAPATPQAKVVSGWSSSNEPDVPSTVSISEIPYDLYDLIVYVGHDRGGENTIFSETSGAFSAFETVENVTGDTLSADPFAYEGVDLSGGSGNFFRVPQLTAESLDIEFTSGGDRAPFNAFQIVEVGGLGDVNADGVVDLTDYGIIRDNFRMDVASRDLGDLNLDGNVNFTDFIEWRENASAAVLAQAGYLSVPEPTSALLLALGAASLALGRSRRC
ncbi:MAG: PEP-CTERM sorting domain-containing protein [Planctomycetota bacterium]